MNHWHKVTTDPKLHAELLALEDEIGTPALVDVAHQRGLYPPGYPDVDAGITVAFAPDDPPDSNGTLIWDLDTAPISNQP
ncbi:MAG: hypothetical protein ACRD0P_03750 [Stackebrandtia sp.]